MRRREFIKVIVGSAGWPLAVHAHRKRWREMRLACS